VSNTMVTLPSEPSTITKQHHGHTIRQVDWGLAFSTCLSAIDFWQCFVDIINKGVELFVPVKKVSRLKKSVYPTNIKKMLAWKSALWRACKAKKLSVLKKNINSVVCNVRKPFQLTIVVRKLMLLALITLVASTSM